jgi:hypothetical protein
MQVDPRREPPLLPIRVDRLDRHPTYTEGVGAVADFAQPRCVEAARYSLSPLLDASGATYRVDRLLAGCWYRMFMRPRGSEAATVAAQQTC